MVHKYDTLTSVDRIANNDLFYSKRCFETNLFSGIAFVGAVLPHSNSDYKFLSKSFFPGWHSWKYNQNIRKDLTRKKIVVTAIIVKVETIVQGIKRWSWQNSLHEFRRREKKGVRRSGNHGADLRYMREPRSAGPLPQWPSASVQAGG